MALALKAEHFRNGVIRAILTVRRALPVYPDKQTFSEPVGMSQGAITGSQLISITSSGHSSLPKHLGFISKRPARCSSSHNMAPIAFLGACFWVDGQKQTYPNQYLKVVLLSGGLHERALGLRILA